MEWIGATYQTQETYQAHPMNPPTPPLNDKGKLERDGVWTNNGLQADFRLLYKHPNCPGVYRVVTASGEHYALEAELTWDPE